MGSWGEDSNQVTIGRGREVLEQAEPATFPRPGEPVVGEDGTKRWVIAVGDPPLGMIQYRFVVDGCPYILWTESGLTWDEALNYASKLQTLTGNATLADATSGPTPNPVGRNPLQVLQECETSRFHVGRGAGGVARTRKASLTGEE